MSPPSTQHQNAHLASLTSTYQTLQSTLQTLIAARQKLESQHAENSAVKHEFEILDMGMGMGSKEDDDGGTTTTTKKKKEMGIYKMVGPVLVRQEKAEAEEAVRGRLGWIGGEMKRVEKEIEDKEAESEKMKMEVYQLQSQLQQQQQQQQTPQTAGQET